MTDCAAASNRKGLYMGIVRFIALAAAFLVMEASACTGMYVGRKVSATGATLLGRTVDLPPTTRLFRIESRPRVKDVPGRVHRGSHGFSWSLPATTWHYVCTPATASNGLGDFTSIGMNEKGLAVTATVSAYPRKEIRDAEPFIKTGLAEESMTSLIAMVCSTAREGVELIAEVMEKAGSHEGSIVMLADPDEAWYVEIYSGRQWAAVRMPEDKVAAFGNEYSLRGFDPAAPDVRASPGLVELPRKVGTLAKTADGHIDLMKSYLGVRCDFAHYRTWYGRRFLAGEKAAGAYSTGCETPLFYVPSRAIGPADLFALMRSRNEGTEWSPETTRRMDVRTIGDEVQCTDHVLEVRGDMPLELACTAWVCLGAAEHSVFLPVNAVVTSVAEAFSRDSAPDATKCAYDPALAAARFRRLSAFAELDRVLYGQGVRDYWESCERRLLAAEPGVRAEARRLYAESPAKAAEYLTCRAVGLQEAALSDARRMFDDLMWHVTDANRARRYNVNYYTRVLSPMPPVKPFVPDAKSLRLISF